jgi:DNA-binding response OmpR family regulator
MVTEKATQTRSVTIIDDDLTLSGLVKMKVEEEYQDVETYSNGLKGFEAVKKNNPDALILDVMLPGMQGFDILRKIKEDTTLTTKVLLLTAKNRDEDVDRGFELKADEYMSKPFKMNELLLRIRKMLS